MNSTARQVSTWALLLFLFSSRLFGQTDNIGPGRALSFDGINDYVDYGNILDDLALPVTISAWINMSAAVTDWTPIFVSQDNGPIHNGLTFIVKLDQLCIAYGDGRGELSPQFRRTMVTNIGYSAGSWIHVTGIIRSATSMDLYVNGAISPGTVTGTSDQPMSASPTDVAKTGHWFSNGITFRYAGMIDEIRIWRRALTVTEIRESMCRKIASADLAAHWSFDETSGSIVRDSSPNHFDGVLRNGTARVYSGAAIGDVSSFNYLMTPSSELSLQEGTDLITIDNWVGATGVQLYGVRSLPSRVGGMEMSCIQPPYFGVFVTHSHTALSYDLKYSAPGTAKLFVRTSNEVMNWTEQPAAKTGPNTISAIGLASRTEVIDAALPVLPDLGPDTLLCNNTIVEIESNIQEPGATLQWSTGAQSKSIFVSTAGVYWLDVTGSCGIARDSILVASLEKPQIAFEQDEICSATPIALVPISETGYESLQWHDGSSADSLLASTSGTFWVMAFNQCGSDTDSVEVSINDVEFLVPNVVTPNGDAMNDTFVIDPKVGVVELKIFNRWGREVFAASNYKNDWAGQGLADGVYFYMFTHGCSINHVKGVVSLLR
jgi:gliding motility-associated-like protein